jgi:transposase
VGPLTALAYVLIIGTPTRFQRGKQIGTYVGMIPCEESSAGKTAIGSHQQARQFVVALLERHKTHRQRECAVEKAGAGSG